MADYTDKAHFFAVLRCPAVHEAEGDRLLADHAAWVARTHPRDGGDALLHYAVSKSHDDEGNALFLLSEVYATKPGIDNHRKLAADSWDEYDAWHAWVYTCESIGWGDADVLHSLS